MDNQHDLTDESADDEVRARREFLKKCGKYAVVVPPTMALLLARDGNAGTSNGPGTILNSFGTRTTVPGDTTDCSPICVGIEP